ncbi:hypothetical protein OBBRIDRAFT_807097 [Obba rivulosa]|uniref:Uncharacterized protein n=1 Tax=Obba rivulosa TaxID=1052685 RepID=A0A8E2AV89_9APHY|nr:hypothetical protein OBBRIDRAFT_807097 [Obba rivulosa]
MPFLLLLSLLLLGLFKCNQRRAWQVNPIFTSPTQDHVESPECIPYSYPPVPSTSSLPRPKPIRPRTPPPLYETHPFSEEVCIVFPFGLNEDAASLVSQDLIKVRISEELEIAEIAEEITGISGVRREPGAANCKSPSPQGRVVRPNPKQYGLWGSIVFRSGVVAGHGLSFDTTESKPKECEKLRSDASLDFESSEVELEDDANSVNITESFTRKYKVAEMPAYLGESAATIAEDFGATKFMHCLDDYMLKQLSSPHSYATPQHYTSLSDSVKMQVPSVPQVTLSLRSATDAIHASPGDAAQDLRLATQAKFSTVLVRDSALQGNLVIRSTATPLSGLQVAQVVHSEQSSAPYMAANQEAIHALKDLIHLLEKQLVEEESKMNNSLPLSSATANLDTVPSTAAAAQLALIQTQDIANSDSEEDLSRNSKCRVQAAAVLTLAVFWEFLVGYSMIQNWQSQIDALMLLLEKKSEDGTAENIPYTTTGRHAGRCSAHEWSAEDRERGGSYDKLLVRHGLIERFALVPNLKHAKRCQNGLRRKYRERENFEIPCLSTVTTAGRALQL